MADKDHVPAIGAGRSFEDAIAASGGEDDGGVVVALGRRLRLLDGGHFAQRQQFHGGGSARFDGGKILPDPRRLFSQVNFRLNTAPLAPASAFTALGYFVGEDGLDAQKLANARLNRSGSAH